MTAVRSLTELGTSVEASLHPVDNWQLQATWERCISVQKKFSKFFSLSHTHHIRYNLCVGCKRCEFQTDRVSVCRIPRPGCCSGKKAAVPKEGGVAAVPVVVFVALVPVKEVWRLF